MAIFIYKGEGERVFPSLGITVKKGDEFDAPADFSASDVVSAKSTKSATAPTVGE